ncbi:MAG: asparagine synthetase B family protein, partial [Spirochaetota bacterium]
MDHLHNSKAHHAQVLRNHLIEASRLRFTRSDVPVGAYLSGGIDSSLISSIVNSYTESPLSTYSMRFTDEEYDEGRYQHDMIQRLGTRHSEAAISHSSIGDIFPTVIWHTECPILRTAPAPLFLLSRLVHECGHKVVVTGEGADEVLLGYDIFREAKARLFLSRDPASRKRLHILDALYPWVHRSPSTIPAFGRAFFKKALYPSDPAFSHRPRWTTTAALQNLLHQDLQAEIHNLNIEEELLGRLSPAGTTWDMLSRAQWLEYTTLLSGYLLSSQGDRMLMAHSVEGRFPFLDCSLVDFANGVPPQHKLFALDEKHLLKIGFSDLLPPSILQRPKQPYRAPDAASFFGTTHEWVDDLVSEQTLTDAGIFNPPAVHRLVEKCRQKKGMHMSNTDNMR